MDNRHLFLQALGKFLLGVVIIGLLLFLAMPLVLASPISFLIMLLYLPLIAKRIRNEESVLEEGLEGYREYKKRVRYKVIPFIW
ncbi:MAG: hypothetical protein J6T49_05520 [Bacteroidales bacterium]|nr:hypothetical protein [Bacteroidales bacterium]MBO7487097.1 hypothetical protein [Bacteroidales bacterium]